MATGHEPELSHAEDFWRAHLDELGRALRALLQSLIFALKRDYELDRQRVGDPRSLLHLVLNDPYFAWIRPFSEAIGYVDTLLELEGHIEEEDAAAVRVEIERVLDPVATDSAFARTYFPLLQSHVSVAGAHAEVRGALARLPSSEPERVEELMQRKHVWAARRARRAQ